VSNRATDIVPIEPVDRKANDAVKASTSGKRRCAKRPRIRLFAEPTCSCDSFCGRDVLSLVMGTTPIGACSAKQDAHASVGGRNWHPHPRAAQLIETVGWVIWTSIL